MKIVFVHNVGKNIRGGAERVVQAYAKTLSDQGNVVLTVATETFHSNESFFVHAHELNDYAIWVPNIISFEHLHRLKKWQRFFWHIIDVFNLWSVWQWRSFLREEKPDIIWTHNLTGVGALPLALRWFFPHLRWIHTLHDPQLIEPSGLLMIGQEDVLLRPSLIRRIWIRISAWWIGSPTLVTSPSRWLLTLHKERHFFYRSRSLLSKNPSSLPSAFTGPRVVQHPPIVLWVGQLEIHRGIYFFLDALQKQTHTRQPALDIVIVGDGRLREDIVHLYNTKALGVTFMGKQTDQQMQRLWDHAQCVVITSLCYENAPTVITEAHARGIPVLAPSLGGIPEMVRDGVTGWLYPPNNEAAFIRAFDNATQHAKRFLPITVTPTQQLETVLRSALL